MRIAEIGLNAALPTTSPSTYLPPISTRSLVLRQRHSRHAAPKLQWSEAAAGVRPDVMQRWAGRLLEVGIFQTS